MEAATSPALTSQEIAQATAQLRAAHQDETSPLQRAVDRLTACVGWPGFVAALTVAIACWIGANLMAMAAGLRPADPPPFFWLQGAITAGALYVAALILTTQRRADQLSRTRAQLILEFALLGDQKLSKLIELMEEGRRDNPMLSDRVDDQAAAMSTPSDHRTVLDAIKEVEDGLEGSHMERRPYVHPGGLDSSHPEHGLVSSNAAQGPSPT
ncbi:MAG TPA: DUF1003 domain-containing protein [Phenylobacterium sp.]|jgi:uncharacterized membrane protein|nr:DUF1003 domain-containing protein [Phenylobacterium sp.]